MPAAAPRGAPITVETLKKRKDFLALRQGMKAHAPSFLLLARKNPDIDGARVGITVTRRLGGAVVRNRIRRRLRAAVREVFPHHAAPGADYVIIARGPAQTRNYAALLDDMKRGLLRLARALK
ncbi:MAG: ribonuclease P protein component [Pseudomonadota bacterium]